MSVSPDCKIYRRSARTQVKTRGRRAARRQLCAALLGAAAIFVGMPPAHAQGSDEERRQMEIEGNKRLEDQRKQQQERATDKANSADQIERFNQREQSRENWIRQLEQRNKQR